MTSPVGFSIPIGARPACLICGDEANVRMGLMKYREPDENGGHYANGWRCRDHIACRDRFHAQEPGQPFPLDETRSRVVFVGEDPAG